MGNEQTGGKQGANKGKEKPETELGNPAAGGRRIWRFVVHGNRSSGRCDADRARAALEQTGHGIKLAGLLVPAACRNRRPGTCLGAIMEIWEQ